MLLYAILVGHFVADFVCQSDWMAINKSKRWDALAWHVLAYFVALAVVLAPVVRDVPPSAVTAFLVANALAHFVQDAITSRITSKLWFFERQHGVWKRFEPAGAPGVVMSDEVWLYVGGSRHWFFVVIGLDQLLHYVTLFATAGYFL